MMFKLAGIRIFNRAMSPDEIKHMMLHEGEIDYLNHPNFVFEWTPNYTIRKIGDEIIVEGGTGYE
jgi:hypothetical protein